MTQRHFVARWLGALGLILSSVGLVSRATTTAQTPLAAGQSQSASPPAVLAASEIFRNANSAIVTITTPTGFGSGVVVDPSGVVVTNLHVIAGGSRVAVKLSNGDIYDDVTVMGFDARRDLVVLQVLGFALKSVPLGNSEDVSTGDRVYAIGAPKGLELTISEGIVSALRESQDGYRVIQTTAPLSPGSSGGGLFDHFGRLIGITTFKIEGGENLNFALPINYVRGMLGSSLRLTLAQLQERIPPTQAVGSAPTPTAPPRVPDSETTVMLWGPRGNAFEGVCRAVTSSGAESRSLAGVLPANFTFRADSLECAFKKLWGGYDSLLVQFVRNGRSLRHALTQTPYGSVSLTIESTQ